MLDRVYDLPDDGEQVEGRAGEAVNARYRHHFAGGDGFQQLQQFTPVGSRARHLLAENPRTPLGVQLLKLERLAVGADASIADEPFLDGFGHILWKL